MTRSKKSPSKPKDPLAGFIDPADAIVACESCGAVEGEPCRFFAHERFVKEVKGVVRTGTVHFSRRLRRLMLTARVRPAKRVEFEAQAVEMLREYLKEKR